MKFPRDHLESTLAGDNPFRLLVDAVTDYAIYMLDPAGHRGELERRAPQRFKGYAADEIIGQHFSRLLHRGRPRAPACRRRRSRPPSATASSRTRAGACARTARASGRMSSSIPIRDAVGRAAGLRQDHPRPHRTQGGRAGAARERGAVPPAGAGRHRLRDLHARRRRAASRAGIPGAERIKGYAPRRDHRPALLALLHRGGPRRRRAGTGAATRAARDGRFEKEGWRVRKDGTRFWAHVVIDPIRDDDGAAASASPRSRATSPSGATAQQQARRRRARRCSSRRRWRRSASSPAASRTTSTTC